MLKEAEYFVGDTKDEDIKKAKTLNVDIVGTILSLMLDDDENDTERIIRMYDDGIPEECAIMDALLTALCGETFASIVDSANEKGLFL